MVWESKGLIISFCRWGRFCHIVDHFSNLSFQIIVPGLIDLLHNLGNLPFLILQIAQRPLSLPLHELYLLWELFLPLGDALLEGVPLAAQKVILLFQFSDLLA